MVRSRLSGSVLAVVLAFSVLTGQATAARVEAVGAPPLGQDTPSAAAAAPIRLLAGEFVPARGEAPTLPPGLTISDFTPGTRGHYIVQFAGPVQQAWKDSVTAEGAELLDYLPDFAFKTPTCIDSAFPSHSRRSAWWSSMFRALSMPWT